MTGTKIANNSGIDLRDRQHFLYPLSEKLAFLRRAVHMLTIELAAAGHPLACKTVDSGTTGWTATVTPGSSGIALPSDYLRTVTLFIKGLEANGPLDLVAGRDRFQGAGTPTGYYIMGGATAAPTLHLVPTPASAHVLTLHYAAMPAFALLDEPTGATDEELEAAATAQLAQEIPYSQAFGEMFRAFVTFACANRNEYDTTVEQGLWKLCKDQAAGLVGMDNLQPLDLATVAAGGDSCWTGR